MARSQTTISRQSTLGSGSSAITLRGIQPWRDRRTVVPPRLASVEASLPHLSSGERPSPAIIPEVVPASEYAQTYQTLQLYKTLYESSLPKRPAPVPIMWDQDVEELLKDVLEEAEQEDMHITSDEVISCARDVLYSLSDQYTSEPSLTHDDKGGIEIFLKEGRRGLLIKVQVDGVLGIFGDRGDEQWRAKYQTNGSAWKKHMTCIINALTE